MYRRIVVSAVVAWLVVGAAPLMAQSMLQRLEQSIRHGAPGEAAPAPTPNAEAAAPAAAPADAEGKTHDPGYLGALVDDRNVRGRGVQVVEVRAGGPAAAAGLQQGDLVTSIDGIRVRQMRDLADLMSLYSAGEKAVFEVQREGRKQSVEVTLGQRPPEVVPPPQPNAAGASGAAGPSDPTVMPEIVPPPIGAVLTPPEGQSARRPLGQAASRLLNNLLTPPSPMPGAAVAPPPNNAAMSAAGADDLQTQVRTLQARVAQLEAELEQTRRELQAAKSQK